MKKILLITFLGLLTFTACKKENFETFTPKDTFETTLVKASFSGIIVDEHEKGLENVAVSNGLHKTTTDKNGVFFFTDIEVPSHKAYFTASKDGYFQGSRTIFAQAKKTHTVHMKMLSSTPIGSFSNATGGVISLPEGGQLIFEAGDVALPNGTAYSGTVHVAAKRIDPTQTNGRFEMPGDLRGINANEENVILQSYGMMAVELTDQSGNLLQVAPNQSVDISFEVPSSLVSSAPTSIPLWYFDEINGDWKEEGSATLSGNTYLGAVSHFSFWNCDAQFPTVFFEANFVDATGSPLVNQTITITIDGWTTYGITNDDGWVGGLVLANSTMQLGLINICGQSNYIQDFTTSSSDLNLGSLTVIIEGMNSYTITGTVLNCDELPITNGYLSIVGINWYSNFVMQISEANNFSTPYSTCNGLETAVIGYDYDSFLQSEEQHFNLTTNSNIGEIHACNTVIDEYFTLFYPSATTGNDTTTTMIPPNLWIGGNFENYIQFGGDNLQFDAVTFIAKILDANEIGLQTYFIDSLSIQQSNSLVDTIHYAPCNIEITSFPASIGDYLEGNITQAGTPVISGSFRIKRSQ